MYLQNVISKKNSEKNQIFFVGILEATKEKAGSGPGSGSVSQSNGSVDPDPYPTNMSQIHKFAIIIF